MTNTKKDLLPEPSIYGEDGSPLFSLEDLIAHWQLSVEEMQVLEEKFLKPAEKEGQRILLN